MQQRTDDELLAFVGQGDRPALDELFKRHYQSVYGLLLRLNAGDAQKAEDMSQLAWMEVIRVAPKYKPEGKARSYILSVARNQARNAFRKEKRWKHLELDESRAPSAEHEAEAQLIESQEMERLRACIDQLPDRQRYALTTWLADGITQKELAQEMEVSHKAMEGLLLRAKTNLAKILKGEES